MKISNAKTSAKTTALSARTAAVQILFQVLDQGKSLSSLLPDAQTTVKAQDLPLLQEICFGVCRVLPRLEQIIAQLVDKPLRGKKRIVHCLLLVGLYQILYTRIPAYAAVDEVVNTTKALQLQSFQGLVNAVLRRFLREQESMLAKVDKHWQTLHPDWLVNKLKKQYPNWREIIEANNQKPPMWLRVNTQKNSLEAYRTLLTAQQMDVQITSHPQALGLMQPTVVQHLPLFAEGGVTVQDLHAQWAALLLQPQNGELILDACAAPGGKTTHILELVPQAEVIALDVEENRLQRVNENLARMQQQATVVCGDAANPQAWLTKLGKSAVRFDRILLDAPCSATGVIRRHPDIKWLRKEADIEPLVELQEQILQALWTYLKPNGVLLYATCSVLAEENARQIERFLQRTPDAQLAALNLPEEVLARNQSAVGFQFIPQIDGGDGFYYAKLVKREN
ncbi:16S rRNA (cytosine(967)-C(5))-methyltransferase RsmB [Aggregatibacter actinomycetemcomitans]|uniref:16S rRNA (cytosine(967)-C(5))-methyltransferase RsmB n=1 Tax=Aggregatibacter actinomycetemcomitans TaxID=714 RepID=UPI00197B0DBE|nr:16S rRNA (cytosine(967)-C(5))-methyltransferase RsmB [Aggregatibacter actinomycetemcomitans]MBN6069604.1 16S rRNA (cytosine(967)-C(5))-methyltransferase RsmB [Aggregatibacter actinomycetemcomitans]